MNTAAASTDGMARKTDPRTVVEVKQELMLCEIALRLITKMAKIELVMTSVGFNKDNR